MGNSTKTICHSNISINTNLEFVISTLEYLVILLRFLIFQNSRTDLSKFREEFSCFNTSTMLFIKVKSVSCSLGPLMPII